ncbi:nck-associated protein 5-like isoform X2 [Ambystoma mexicanum]|uniref:nck-associated protein 5-like isoform X2 n=1 Tax=Ambystoma mexicanum TaxID=8296 RepID=UPI0037E97EF1
MGEMGMASEAVDLPQRGGDLVPGDGVLELGVSRELLGRLRELEAKNSALALANENQREAYERCLDEVANHVVQALLNQKDLREECLKLKKKVLDLERQNRTLSDLFQQKLQLSSVAVPQLQTRPQPIALDGLQGALEKHPASPLVGHCSSPVNRERPHGTSPASSSLDALSPFLKKKAQILEVLRKLEEADPLLTCPTSHPPLPGHADFSVQWKAERHWELSTAIVNSTTVEGGGPGITHGPEAWASRLLVAQNGLEDLLRWKTGGRGPNLEGLQTEEEGGILDLGSGGCVDLEPADLELLTPHCCNDLSGPSSSSSSDDSGEQTEMSAPVKGPLLSAISMHEKDFLQDADSYLSVMIENGIRNTVNGDRGVVINRQINSETWPSKDGLPSNDLLSKALEKEVLREISQTGKIQLETEDTNTPEPSHVQLELVNSTSAWQEADKVAEVSSVHSSHAVKRQVKALSEAPSHKETFISTYVSSGCLGPTPESDDPACKILSGTSGLGGSIKRTSDLGIAHHHGEQTPIPVPSPSKILKFLKMPNAADRTQSPNHLRLSPQLTRSSKIPCRNNYEVYHSPVPARRPCRGEEDIRCTGRSQLVLDAEVSVNSMAKSEVPVQCSPVSVRNSAANLSEQFCQEAPRTPNYENLSEITVQNSTGVLQTCSSHLVHQLIRPVRESEVSELSHPPCFSMPASPVAPVEEGLPDLETGHSSTDIGLHPCTATSRSEPMQPETCSSGPVDCKRPFPGLKPEIEKKMSETSVGHLPFQVRLTALGKLRSTESLQADLFTQPDWKEDRGVEGTSQVTANNQRNKASLGRSPEMGESLSDCPSEPRVFLKRGGGSKSLRQAEVFVNGEPRARCYHSNSVGSKAEANYSPKSDHPSRHRGPPGSPQASRASGKHQAAGNGSKNARSPHGSPTKLPAKSPLKTSAPKGPLSEEGKQCSPPSGPPLLLGPDDKVRVQQLSMGRRSTCAEYAPRTPPATRTAEKLPLSSTLHSAIEEKVMKGIEENMLRLKEQDRTPVVEVKQKNSSGIASWFGLKKSKLPALSRRPDAFKVKEEKRGMTASPPRREGRAAAKKQEVESLNISMLMEKAEDLRKALEAEKAYMRGLSAERNRAHPSSIILEQTQSELKVIYSKEVTPDNFMRQLLNRVDGKDMVCENPLDLKSQLSNYPNVAQETKDPPTSRSQRNGMVSHLQHCKETPDQIEDGNIREEVPSDDSLTESVTSQHFTACGSLTRTLDSGIGTFPPPDYCSGSPSRSVPRLKAGVEVTPIAPVGGPPALLKVPRKARTLEREVPSMEEVLVPGQHHSVPAFHALLTTPEPAMGQRVHRLGKDLCVSPSQRAQQGKNWTFPNARVPAGSTDIFLSNNRELEIWQGTGKAPADRKPSDMPRRSPCAPLVFPSSITSRAPIASDVGEDGTSDLKSHGAAQTGLESSESLSDSLYDSLSSCGSQG